MWIPDVYEGAPTSVTLFLTTAPKLSGFALAMRLLADGLPGLAADWQQMLAVLAVLPLLESDAKLPYALKDRVNRAVMSRKIDRQALSSASWVNFQSSQWVIFTSSLRPTPASSEPAGLGAPCSGWGCIMITCWCLYLRESGSRAKALFCERRASTDGEVLPRSQLSSVERHCKLLF